MNTSLKSEVTWPNVCPVELVPKWTLGKMSALLLPIGHAVDVREASDLAPLLRRRSGSHNRKRPPTHAGDGRHEFFNPHGCGIDSAARELVLSSWWVENNLRLIFLRGAADGVLWVDVHHALDPLDLEALGHRSLHLLVGVGVHLI